MAEDKDAIKKLADALATPVTLKVGDLELKLKPLTLSDLCEIEEQFGTIDEWNILSFRLMRAILYRAAKDQLAGVPEDEFGRMMSMVELAKLTDIITDVLRRSGIAAGEAGKSEVQAPQGQEVA